MLINGRFCLKLVLFFQDICITFCRVNKADINPLRTELFSTGVKIHFFASLVMKFFADHFRIIKIDF